MQEEELSFRVIGCAQKVHRALGGGFVESVYENALCVELGAPGLRYEQQKPVEVRYAGQAVGHFVADILVEEGLILELKAVQRLVEAHEVQLVNYLTATGIDHGLLLNFGAASLQVKHKYRNYRPSPKSC